MILVKFFKIKIWSLFIKLPKSNYGIVKKKKKNIKKEKIILSNKEIGSGSGSGSDSSGEEDNKEENKLKEGQSSEQS